MILLGVDWAADDHDLTVMDPEGRVLAHARVADGLDGVGRLHALVADHVNEAGEVVVGIEIDRGLLVTSLVAARYAVYAVNPKAVARYRDRHAVSGAKSDARDSKTLADLVRTDRHNHRPVAGDTHLAEAIKVTARAHQSLIWTRQRQANQLRSALREYYPGALAAFGPDLAHPDALAMLAKAPTPELGRRLSQAQLRATLKRAGRQRNLDRRAQEIREALRADQLAAPVAVADAYGDTTKALVGVIAALSDQISELENALTSCFESHPDADILRSLPTKASGKHRAVLARFVRNHRLADALTWWALCSLQASPGARAFYDAHRAAGDTHHQALRALSNRWVGILHGCLRHHTPYDEHTACAHREQQATLAA